MSKIEEADIGQSVFVKSKNELGAVVGKKADSLSVALLTGTVEVKEGDFELSS